MLIKWLIGLVVLAAVVVIAIRVGIAFVDIKPASLGIDQGRLTNCPNTTNCVSSYSTSNDNRIPPIRFHESREYVYTQLLAVIASIPGSVVRAQTENYIHAEFKSRLFGFIDDTEFLFETNEPQIQIRSASRTGRWDFGVNRKRLDAIRTKLTPED